MSGASKVYLIKGFGSLHAGHHVQPCRLDDLKGDVEAQLVEEVGHLLAQPIGCLQAWLRIPVDKQQKIS